MDIGHSRLLKFFGKFKMAEKHNLKIEVPTPSNIESEVPKQQILRPEYSTLRDDDRAEIPITDAANGEPEAWTSLRGLLEPVFVGEPVRPPPRVWRKAPEVPESVEDCPEGKKTKTRIPVSRFKTAVDKVQRERKDSEEANEQKSKKQAPEKPPRRSSIPKLNERIRAARKNAYKSNVGDRDKQSQDKEANVETIDKKTVKTDRIPVLRKDPNRPRESDKINMKHEPVKAETNEDQTHSQTNDEEQTDTKANEQLEDEFDKLYEEIVDTGVEIIPDEILNTKVKDPEKLEIKFEEIVHQYDEKVKVEPADKARYSKIPLLKRRSEQEIKIPKLSERRLSLKTSYTTDKVDKMRNQEPVSDTVRINDENKLNNNKPEKIIENYSHTDKITEINNNDHNRLHVTESPAPAFDVLATPDTELVKVGLSHLDIALENHNLNQNKDNDDITTFYVETADVSILDEPTEIEAVENDQSIELEEGRAEYTIEEPISINEDIVIRAFDNPNINEVTDNHTLIENDALDQSNISGDTNVVLNQNDTVKVATINLDMPVSEEAKMNYNRQSIIIPNNDEFKSVNLLRSVNSVEERTKSRFINKPLKKENDIYGTELEEDIPIVKGKVSRILNRLTSHNNASNDKANNKCNEQIESKKDDLPATGNLSKILNRITSHDIEQSIKKEFNEIPKKKSVLSKIAMFERPNPEPVVPKKPAVKYSDPQRTISEEIKHLPKIVHEVLKPSIRNGQTDKPYEVITVDILKPVEVITSNEEQVLVVEDLKEQSIVYENLDNSKNGEINTIANELTEQATGDNETIVSNDHDKNENTPEEHPSIEAEDNNKTTCNLDTSVNRFSHVDPRVENWKNKEVISRYVPVKEKINRLQSHDESNMKRAKSTAELDLGDAIKGKVKNMIYRMNSFEVLDENVDNKQKETISVKERPRKRSVSEKIALFEKKLTPVKMESVESARAFDVDTKSVDSYNAIGNTTVDEEFDAKVKELVNAKIKYGVANMTYMELADGAKMPVLALGTALLEPRLAKYIVGAAIDLGFRAIDTAFIYGNEKEVGEGIRAKIQDGTVRREELFITSKLWSTFHQPELVEPACRASLRTLGLDYFDLFMIHNPMSFKEGGDPLPKIANVLQFSSHEYLDAWFAMERLPAALARRVGVSNFNSTQVARVLEKGRVAPAVNQVECHPYLNQQRLSAFCEARGVALSCFGTLGSKGTPAELKASQAAVIDDPLVQVMAAGLGISPAQLLISYQLHCGHQVVVKGSTAAHLWDDLQALQAALAPAQLDALHALNRNKRTFTFKGMGDTHRNYPFQVPF